MTEAFTAGVMIFIEQFRARWPWSIGVLESWLSMSSSSFSKSQRLPFSGFLPLNASSPAVGDIFRSGRCRGSQRTVSSSRLHLIYVVHAYCYYVIGQHSDNWNLIVWLWNLVSHFERGAYAADYRKLYRNQSGSSWVITQQTSKRTVWHTYGILQNMIKCFALIGLWDTHNLLSENAKITARYLLHWTNNTLL